MSEDEDRTSKEVGGTSHRQFSCIKCSHVNSHNAVLCFQCGAHLFLKCKECGHINQRTSPRCTECGHGLRRSWWSKKIAPKLRAPRRPITRNQLILLVIAIAVTFKIILIFSNGSLPANGP